jgi:hypothetical protein
VKGVWGENQNENTNCNHITCRANGDIKPFKSHHRRRCVHAGHFSDRENFVIEAVALGVIT